ncbi:MAG: hypothetical protein PHO76_12165 [Methylotenera sp.]|nr:hypothetical protein [Methylotenera sp.]MDD4926986.1 hypothetical protein [Methylotenera sp.]
MSSSLLIYSHDFQINVKKLFKAHDVHMIDINAEVMSNATHKNYKLMSELVKCLFEGYDQLTLITNFVPKSDHGNLFDERSLAFIFKTNDIKDTYELNDFHAAVMSNLTSHRLLVESQMFRRKELVSSQLSKATNNVKTLNALINDYDDLINKSKCVLDNYREDLVLRFGVKP